MNASRTIDKVLDLARWAPSGDNTQPWAFEVIDDAHAVVHGHDTRDHCVYDLDGRASQMSLGALLETASIGASALGHRVSATLRDGSLPTHPTFDLRLQPDPAMPADPLAAAIERRSVQRRPYRTTALTDEQKARLAQSLGPDHAVRWVEGPAGRARMALLLFRSARLRLVTQEAYQVHRDVIEWDARFSVDRVPDQALGVGRPMIALMRFAMASWGRVQFFNRFLAGTWMPRLQMDLLPAWACGAHFLITARTAPTGVEDQVAAGRAMQRFWLTATDLGLAMQPELTPLIFGRYAREGRPFSKRAGSLEDAARVAGGLESLLGADALALGVFMGRLGHAPAPTSRSLRKPLDALARQEPEVRHG